MVAAARQLIGGQRRVRQRGARAGQAGGALPGCGEVVREAPRRVGEHVDDHDLIREIEDEVALRGVAPLGERHRLELERQVVPEGAVQPELHLEIVTEEINQRAHDAKDGVLPAALLLGEEGLDLLDRAVERGLAVHLQAGERGDALQRRADRRQQRAASLVERRDSEAAAPSLEGERRVDEAHGPARVPPRHLVRRLEDAASLLVQLVDQTLERLAGVGQRLDQPVDGHPALGDVTTGGRLRPWRAQGELWSRGAVRAALLRRRLHRG